VANGYKLKTVIFQNTKCDNISSHYGDLYLDYVTQ